MPRSSIARLYDNSSFFVETSLPSSTMAAPIYIPTNSVWGFPFLHTLQQAVFLISFRLLELPLQLLLLSIGLTPGTFLDLTISLLSLWGEHKGDSFSWLSSSEPSLVALRSCPPGTRAVELGGSGFSAGDWGDGLQSSQTSFHPHRFPEADTAHFHLLLCPAVTHLANKGKWNTAHRSWPPATRYSMHGDSLAGRAPQPSLAGPGHSPFSPRPGTGSDDKWLRNDDRERLRTVGQGRGRGAGGNTRGSQSCSEGVTNSQYYLLGFLFILGLFSFCLFLAVFVRFFSMRAESCVVLSWLSYLLI